MPDIDATEDLDRGRRCFERREWRPARAALMRAGALSADDLERLAVAAYMLGREDEYVEALERAHAGRLAAGDPARAARCAFWAGLSLRLRGELARANGWFARAERLLEREGECAERGYLLIPALLDHVAAGDDDAAHATAAEAAAIGERFGDRDLVALTVQEQGHALLRQGRRPEGLRLIDEAMLAATTGELSQIVTGLVYCNTIAFCQAAYELARAREWTEALSRWCDSQPDMVAHTGVCMVHRAEIMELAGDWSEALREARRAEAHSRADPLAGAEAVYRRAEVHRLRGELGAAEEAYRAASRLGFEPQPGLALLRLAQGRTDAAAVAIRRALGETPEPLRRVRLLQAAVEVLTGAEARAAADELERIADRHRSATIGAIAAHARGAVELAEGNPRGALPALRRACEAWRELDVPYESARARLLAGLACRELGDEEAAALELEAAQAALAALGAADAERAASLIGPDDRHGLTRRELEVLRLVAAGKSNREIARDLVISEHTVARHVHNILAKLRLRSRTAAGAFAFEHRLV